MKNRYLCFFTILVCIIVNAQLKAQSCSVSAIYGGGPFYKYPSIIIPETRASGFTIAIVWNIAIDASGDLNFNGEFSVVTNGSYVGSATYSGFPANMALLKTAPTSVNRVEFSIGASGSSSFSNIETIIAAQGTGPTSILYKNFKILKDSIPAIDAIDFDDESTYNLSSTVQFAVMLANLGYKVTLCPYTNYSYWDSVAVQTNRQIPGAVDAVYLQCYSGGAGNNPCTWKFNGIPVYPGLWDNNYTSSGVQTKMAAWKTSCNIMGGFMWLYDDFYQTTGSAASYAAAINTALSYTVTVKSNVNSDVTCGGNNGSASSTVSGGISPYTYSWTGGGTNSNVSGLSAGTYTLTVTDHYGCTKSASVTITQTPAISNIVVNAGNIACNGSKNGSATVEITGGTSPYTYSWTGNKTTAIISGLSAGTYTVTVHDANDCSTTASVIITQPATALSVTTYSATAASGCIGVAAITASGGAAPYTYSWSPGGATTDTLKNKCAGSYCCTVTDNNGCMQTACVTITGTTTGIDGINNTSNIHIYPDPNMGSFTVVGVTEGQVIGLYNILGQEISSITADKPMMEFNISNQVDGIYLVRILDKDGSLVTQKKMVKMQ